MILKRKKKSAWPILEFVTLRSKFVTLRSKFVTLIFPDFGGRKWSSKSGWNILTKPHVLDWNFFQGPLEIFYWLYEHVQGIWKVRSTKLMVAIKHLIHRKSLKIFIKKDTKKKFLKFAQSHNTFLNIQISDFQE